MSRTTGVAGLLALLGATCLPGLAQVHVPILVTTERGVPVGGLTKENFHLFEDNSEQHIDSLTAGGPLSLGILVDTSGSMRESLPVIGHAVVALLREQSPIDEVFLIEFNDTARVVVPLTSDPMKIVPSIMEAQALGRTRLLDAIDLGVRELQRARWPPRAMVIFSDGGDNASRTTSGDIRRALSESDVQLFAVGLFKAPGDRLPDPEEAEGPHLLNQLARETGGMLYAPEKPDALRVVVDIVAGELRGHCMLSYSPSHPLADGKHHRIKIKLEPPAGVPKKLEISYRQGYTGN